MPSTIVIYQDYPFPWTIFREQEEFGYEVADIFTPIRRLLDREYSHLPCVMAGIDRNRINLQQTPSQLLQDFTTNDKPLAITKRSLLKLLAHFLVCEDPQRRLDARPVSTLSHQVSLVRHILDHDHLRRVLIADEVGLGKTVEAGLLLKELLDSHANLRILYLAPARLVSNVRREFDRLDLHFRQWASDNSDARLTDSRIVASVHRAVHREHRNNLLATDPWDVLVVDECHHLSDWADGGGDPREKYKLVRDLINRQRDTGRVVLLSGTPHQGHTSRFENLIDLLRRPDEPATAIEGRVIYRTKDDIVDWEGNLLFPRRNVSPPLVVDLGGHYRKWIENIHRFFQPPKDSNEQNESRRRAAGWRCAQALQWAASSPHAGLGYLVRQAIRAGWSGSDPVLKECLLALRPYRNGSANESSEALFKRMEREVKQPKDNSDLDDIEDEIEIANPRDDREGLSQILSEGLTVLQESGNAKWELIKREIIDKSDNEKIVFFAQPIETVIALARYLELELGSKPALIIGGQSDDQREAQVRDFRRVDGARFLVSSKAGGEGINLQTARRLVHLDIPWNPMEMEQRVGRVHRFGSRKEILVETIVVKDSREADAYRIARQKLQLITATMVEPEKFESLFNRVMALTPPEELQDVLLNHATTPLTHADQESLNNMVRNGFERWKAFDERFAEQQRQIKRQDAGLATWKDVLQFVSRTQKDVEHLDGFVSERFVFNNGKTAATHEPIDVIRFSDQGPFAIGDIGGMIIYGPKGETATQLGINDNQLLPKMFQAAFPDKVVGPASVRWPSNVRLPFDDLEQPFAVVAVVRTCLQLRPTTGWTELNSSIHFCIVNGNGKSIDVARTETRLLMDGLLASSGKKLPSTCTFTAEIQAAEQELVNRLRRPTQEELRSGIRYAVAPIFGCLVEPKVSYSSRETLMTSESEEVDEDMSVDFPMIASTAGNVSEPSENWGRELGLDGPPSAYKALSIRQPHAEAILRGIKDTEYRGDQTTKIRGRILIYASLGRSSDKEEDEMMADYEIEDVRCEDLPRGKIVGSVELHDSDGGEWYLRNPVRASELLAPQRQPQPKWFHPFE